MRSAGGRDFHRSGTWPNRWTADRHLYDAVKEKELVARQEAVLNQLRPSDRALLVARIELGYNYAQIARLFGKPSPDAARVAVHRALRRAVDAAK